MPGENLTRAEARERAAVVATESYDVTLDLTTGPTTFASRTVVRFTATPGASTFIDLIAPTVHEVTLNGRVARRRRRSSPTRASSSTTSPRATSSSSSPTPRT